MSKRALTPEEFDALFESASNSIVRVEALTQYAVTDDDPAALTAYRNEVAATVARGVTWERLRVISDPPTMYERWELDAYLDNQAAGETIHIVRRPFSAAPPEFWLFDDHEAVVMHYTDAGEVERFTRAESPEHLSALIHHVRNLRSHAVTLDEYLAASGGAARAS